MHNKDALDLLWKKLKNAELEMFVALIKVDYCSNGQKFTKILQEIATQISTGKTFLLKMDRVSELKTGGNNNHNTSAWPTEGSHVTDGTLYTGSY